jgi:hypothetical protein
MRVGVGGSRFSSLMGMQPYYVTQKPPTSLRVSWPGVRSISDYSLQTNFCRRQSLANLAESIARQIWHPRSPALVSGRPLFHSPSLILSCLYKPSALSFALGAGVILAIIPILCDSFGIFPSQFLLQLVPVDLRNSHYHATAYKL